MARPKSAHPSARSRVASANKADKSESDRSRNRRESLERLLEEEDDFEFTVNFPSPSIISMFDDREPVIYILGWEEAKEEELARYSRMYESWGCVTVRYSCPSRCLYLGGSETHQIARRLASLLPELCVAESPVMVHCLGLNGVNVYNHLRKELNKTKRSLVGVIFEGVRAITIVEMVLGIWRCVKVPGSGVMATLMSLVSTMFLSLQNIFISWIRPSPTDIISTEAQPPSLFILAQDTKNEEDDIYKSRKSIGIASVKVFSECSNFKQILQTKCTQYALCIQDFLNQCLE